MSIDADKLLNKVLELYQSCSSYSDVGEASSPVMGSLRFKTYFCRPSKFRFEWSRAEPGDSNMDVVISENDTMATYFDRESTEHMSLALAIAGATGVSLGAAPSVAHLLMPNLFKKGQFQSFMSQRPYNFLEEADSYLKLRADWRSNCWTTLWLDKVSFAIHRIEEGITPTLEEKKRGVEALERLNAPETEEVRALLFVEEKPHLTTISYKDVKFDIQISHDLFRKL